MDIMSPEKRSRLMAGVRTTGTGPEVALRRALWAEGLRYRLNVALPGSPDLAFKGPRVAVFVDGCFWHSCPVHGTVPASNAHFWKQKLAINRNRDKRVTRQLELDGWRVVRCWEHEVVEDAEAVALRIAAVVKARDR